jgi:hypothetical protein
MKFPGLVLALACILSLVLVAGTGAAGTDEYQKLVRIRLNLSEGHISCTGSGISYAPTPHINSYRGNLTAVIIGENNRVVKTFPVFDPCIQFGDSISGDPESGQGEICGVTCHRKTLDFVVEFPFDRNARAFQLYDNRNGVLLVSENLSPVISEFFRKYPRDPDNPNLFAEPDRFSRGPPVAPVQETGNSSATRPAGSPGVPAVAGLLVLSAAIILRRRVR